MGAKTSRGFAFIEILLVGLLAAFLVYKLLDGFLKEATTTESAQKALTAQGVDLNISSVSGPAGAGYQSMVQSVRSQVRAVEKKSGDRMNDYLQMK